MHVKDHLSAVVCTNADGSTKMEMTIIARAKVLRCFRWAPCRLKNFSWANAWSDSVFMPCLRRWTAVTVLPLMDGCSSQEDLEDITGKVRVATYPPN